MLLRTGLSVSVLALAFCTPAFAQSATEQTASGGPSQRFGEAGQLAISSDAALSIDHTSIGGFSGGSTSIELAPAADYFVARGISLGGFIALKYTKAGSDHATRFSIGPRVGYNWTFSDLLSLWPKVGFSFATTSGTVALPISDSTTLERTTSDSSIALNLFVPLMFHPATHFFAGFGPFLDTDLSGDAKATVIGGKLTLGGWLD
jgi:hypothetical protein